MGNRIALISLLMWCAAFAAAQATPPQQLPPAPPIPQLPPLNVPPPASAGPPLTLQQAIAMAEGKNGDIKASRFQAAASGEVVNQQRAAFFPTITPEASYTNSRQDTRTGFNKGRFISAGAESDVTAKWEILDSGQREYGFLSARRSYQAQQATYEANRRQIVFNVDQSYFNSLRDKALETVAATQTQLSETTLNQTQVQVQVGNAPQKDVKQAQADYLNAKVQELVAKNTTVGVVANLKSLIGWDSSSDLPPLMPMTEPGNVQLPETEDQAIAEGLRDRPDLQADRYNIESLHYEYLDAKQQASLSFQVNAQYEAAFSPDVFQGWSFGVSASLPLFDGGFSMAKARQAQDQELSQRAALVQRERDARASIETDYLTLSQNVQRVQAANLALQASQQNYEAQAEAMRLGAQNSTVVTVLTALVSLVTAESNYVSAIYDYYTSLAQFQLDTGKKMIGE